MIDTIRAIHRLTCHYDSRKHPEVKITQRKIFRKLGTRLDQAYSINRQLLEKLLCVFTNDLH